MSADIYVFERLKSEKIQVTERMYYLDTKKCHKKYSMDACHCVCYSFMYMAQDLNFSVKIVILRVVLNYLS